MSDDIRPVPSAHDGAAAIIGLATLRQRLRRESLVFAAIFSLALFGLSLVLIVWRTEQLLTQLSQDRVVRLVQQVTDEGERGMQFGVAVADQTSLVERLQRMQSEDQSLRAVFVETNRGDPVAMAGDEIRFIADHVLVCINEQGRPRSWPDPVRAKINDIMESSV